MPRYPVLVPTSETTPQQVLDAIRDHLERQGGVCRGPNGLCANRSTAGEACAAACLLTDREAKGVSFGDRPDSERPERLRRFSDLIEDCQAAHDDDEIGYGTKCEPVNVRFGVVALRHGLTWRMLSWGG